MTMVERVPAKASRQMSVDLVGVDSLGELRDEWTALFDEVESDNPFLSYEWAEVCCRHAAESVEPVFAVARCSGKLVGIGAMEIVPVAPWGRQLRFLGGRSGDYRGFLADSGSCNEVTAVLLEGLLTSKRFDSLMLQRFREGRDGRCGASTALAEVGRVQDEIVAVSPFVMLDADWSSYARGRSRNTRHYLRKAKSRLQREGRSAAFWRTGSLDTARLSDIFDVHVARHTAKVGGSRFTRASRRRFFADLSEVFACRGWLDVAGMDIDGVMAAFVYCLQLRGTCFYWVCGLRPEFERYSPGSLLLEYVLEDSFKAGLRKLDFMIGTESYKNKWATGRERDFCVRCWLPGYGARHTLQRAFEAGTEVLRDLKGRSRTLQRLWSRATDRW